MGCHRSTTARVVALGFIVELFKKIFTGLLIYSGLPSNVHLSFGRMVNSILPLNIFANPSPNVYRGSKSVKPLVFEPPSFWIESTYRYQSIAVWYSDDGALFSLNLVQFCPPPEEYSISWKFAPWKIAKRSITQPRIVYFRSNLAESLITLQPIPRFKVRGSKVKVAA